MFVDRNEGGPGQPWQEGQSGHISGTFHQYRIITPTSLCTLGVEWRGVQGVQGGVMSVSDAGNVGTIVLDQESGYDHDTFKNKYRHIHVS